MEITKEQFEAYEKVKESGVTNMFAITTVKELSGLSIKVIGKIMRDYGDLKTKFGG